MRLLVCNVCKSMDEIPDYEGDAAFDNFLNEAVRLHNTSDPKAHDVQKCGYIVKVPTDLWMKYRGTVMANIEQTVEPFGEHALFLRDNHHQYLEDAMDCYRHHGRPEDGCSDYRQPNKVIGRPTPEGRAAAHDLPKLRAGDPAICQWCPIHSVVQQKLRMRAGLYNR